MKSFINKEKMARRREAKSAEEWPGGGQFTDQSRPDISSITVGDINTHKIQQSRAVQLRMFEPPEKQKEIPFDEGILRHEKITSRNF